MTNEFPMSNEKMTNEKKYDLGERTARFGEEVIKFCKKVPATLITTSLISQLVRSATSVGANYREADAAESRKDFKHKISICNKEIKEAKYWLRMIMVSVPRFQTEISYLRREAAELNLIFSKIIITTRQNMSN